MAKKQLTVEEYKAKAEASKIKKAHFAKVFLTSIAVMLALVITFSTVTIAYTYMAKVGTGNVVVAGPSGNVSGGNAPSSDAPADDFSSGDDYMTDAPADDTMTDAPAGEDAPAADDSGASTDAPAANANQEYLDMYKKAMANARTNAKSVIRVKDGAINYKGIVEAGGLSSVGQSLMGMFMADSADAIEVKNEEWDKAELIDASKLTLNGIQKITRVEKGNSYVITIVAKDAVNPKSGADGIGSIAGVIEESQITGAIGSVPGLSLSNINIAYENVTVVATIDKATGNVTALTIDAPCVLGLDAKLALITMNDAKVGIECITEYKISY